MTVTKNNCYAPYSPITVSLCACVIACTCACTCWCACAYAYACQCACYGCCYLYLAAMQLYTSLVEDWWMHTRWIGLKGCDWSYRYVCT